MSEFKRAGPITNILRVLVTRWPDIPTATFASIDGGETFYGVEDEARIGDELEIVPEGKRFRPMGWAKHGIYTMVAKDRQQVIEEKFGDEVAVRRIRG